MGATAYASNMRAVVDELRPLFKRSGFRKQRHTFNREPAPGLIQVINFQMGPYEVGDPVEIPGFRENLYGKFTVNLGVYVREVHDHLSRVPAPRFIAEPYCEIRKRLGELMPSAGDIWWSLDHEPDVLAADVAEPLDRVGLPYLDGLSWREAILQAWYRHGDEIGLPPRGQLSIALIHYHRGERDLAARLVREYLNAEHREEHVDFVATIVADLNLAL
jgi:hypothetical protein